MSPLVTILKPWQIYLSLLISDIFAITLNWISFGIFVMILYCLVCRNISFTPLSKWSSIPVAICKFQSLRPTSYCFVCRWRSRKADSWQKVDICLKYSTITALRCWYLLKNFSRTVLYLIQYGVFLILRAFTFV